MRDPFPPCPEFLSKAITPFAKFTGLTTLPLHIHEVIFFFLLYHSINIYVAPALSRALVPDIYKTFNRRTKINWDVHIVSLFQSVFISAYAMYAMYADEERWTGDRVWGYTGFGGTVQAFGAGYFLWDLMVSTQHVKIFGVGLLLHAISAVLVFSFGFRPFVNYYGPDFLLYELSSPFLNMHWFMDKLQMTGSTLQLINGILLLLVFFGCRLIWGNYASYCVARDVYFAWADPPAHIVEKGLEIPTWLVFVYLGSNLTLNSLNLYWFSRMIQTIRKRFQVPVEKKNKPAVAYEGLIKERGVSIAEDEKVIVEGTELEVPFELVEAVEKKTGGSIRKRKA